MSHTPGPWHFHEDEHSLTAEIHAEYDNGKPRHHVVAVAETVDWLGERLADAVVNAKLIAAAPDLLECVEAMLEEYEEGRQIQPFEIREMCRRARGKARGVPYD